MADNVIVRVPEQQFIRGEDGYSPVVTIENIDHGHSITITDREHQEEGQTFNVLDGDSAYEQAVAGGYTKSEAQFNAELGSFGELSEQAADSAAAAAQSESNAAGSATTATTKAQEAEAAAAQALIRMNSAATSAQAAEDASSFFTSTILPNAVTTINNTRDQAVANVNVAKHTAVQDVSDEGATQISALQTESTTQQAAIQQKGEDVLESIPADYTELTEDVDDLKSAVNEIYDMFPSKEIPFEINQTQNYVNVNTGKGGSTSLPVFATTYVDIQNYDHLVYTKAYGSGKNFNATGATFYTGVTQSTYIPGSSIPNVSSQEYGYEVVVAKVPAGAKYARFTGLSEVEGFFIKGMLISEKPWKGLYVSLLGDSFSALKGYIPAENDAYYNISANPSHSGITQPSEMWWGKVISALGGTPLIIDAWSGSCVCTGIREAAGKTAMVDYSRCNNLHAYIQATGSDEDALLVVESNPGDREVTLESIRTSPFLPAYTPSVGDYVKRLNPDIVIVEGGTNDYSYIENMEQFGTFDGKEPFEDPTGADAKVATFREAYATLIGRVHKEYQLALVVCCAGLFVCRPYTQKYQAVRRSIFVDAVEQAKGDAGEKVIITIQDFMGAIAEIAGLFGCPVINFFTQGFTRYNYYGADGEGFSSDSATQTTHPNKNGMTVIAENVTPKFREACAGFVKWLRENKDSN